VTWSLPTNTGASPLDRWVVRVVVGDRLVSRTVVADPDARRLVVRDLPARGEAVVRVAAGNADGRSRFTTAPAVPLS
jgi:hypothetical protein